MNQVLPMSAELRPLRTEAEQSLIAAFDAAKDSLPGDAAVKARRLAAMTEFKRTGLPHRRMETWHYTDFRAQLRGPQSLAKPLPKKLRDDLCQFVRPEGWFGVVLVDGAYAPDLSNADGIPGVAVTSIAGAFAAGDPRIGALFEDAADPLLALNSALAAGGVLVEIAAGARVPGVLTIAHVTSGEAPGVATVRNVIDVKAGAELRFVEEHLGGGADGWGNTVTELNVGDGAKVKAARLQRCGGACIHVASLVVKVGRNAEFDHTTLTAGGVLSRAQSFVAIAGEGARVGLSGATVIGDKRHADTALTLTHALPRATSRVLYKNAVDGSATGAFQGLITVAQPAQKTDGRMMTRTLLLSDEASFAQKPELEIWADDVQCGHGATSGRIDEGMLFYFLSRGIPRIDAERLLLQAFLAEGIEAVGDPEIAEALEPVLEEWLAAR